MSISRSEAFSDLLVHLEKMELLGIQLPEHCTRSGIQGIMKRADDVGAMVLASAHELRTNDSYWVNLDEVIVADERVIKESILHKVNSIRPILDSSTTGQSDDSLDESLMDLGAILQPGESPSQVCRLIAGKTRSQIHGNHDRDELRDRLSELVANCSFEQ